jgi:NADH dehydrogenase [ubiquinone] 1 alpha subcomplex assembly factor 6
MTRPSLQQSIDIVRTASYQAYLCSLLVPEPARSAVFALRAFHLETGQIKDKTTTVGIARMRLEFWRTAVNSAFDPSFPTVNHPIVQEIELARKNGILFSQSWLQRILNERVRYTSKVTFVGEEPYGSCIYHR